MGCHFKNTLLVFIMVYGIWKCLELDQDQCSVIWKWHPFLLTQCLSPWSAPPSCLHPGVLLLLQGGVPGRRVTEHGVAQASELLVTQGLSSSSCLRDAWQRNGEETQPCPCIPNECPLSQVWVVCMWCIIHLTGKSHFLLSHFIRVPLTLDIESHATRICYLRQIV